METRRSFIKKTVLGGAALSAPYIDVFASKLTQNSTALKLSLAQWSLNRAFFKGELNANDFPDIAKNSFGLNAVEYVNAFYKEYGKSEKFWNQLKGKAKAAGVKNLLIMVDDEGELGNPNNKERRKAIENHYKWINAAKLLGCHSIRVNAFGQGNRIELKNSLVDGLGRLSDYGAKENINVLIENHGLHTSDGKFMTSIIKEVNNKHLGTLPDFGNWCLNAKWGSTQNDKCKDMYDPYQGVADFLPYAKGVSAKSYNFDANGNETFLDYRRLLKTVKDSGFIGYIGIEYEGERLSEPEGIKATKALIEKVWLNLE
ncbi:MAG: TIM barrel protein [Eudoraea sp.]|uniref:sugar phosphate isomerase/epimerase family protein n=1 Tax=Eudoraea sp. TaxID=1979955 RepID=UPI003C75CAA7